MSTESLYALAEEIDQLRAELAAVETLQAETQRLREEAICDLMEVSRKHDDLAIRFEVVKAALRRYARHLPDCDLRTPCACGLTPLAASEAKP